MNFWAGEAEAETTGELSGVGALGEGAVGTLGVLLT
jgi:hypothetical protein